MTNIFFLSERFNNPDFGGIKARNDIDSILATKGFTPIPIKPCHYNSRSISGSLKIIKNGIHNWRSVKKYISNESRVFIQYPFGNPILNLNEMVRCKKQYGCKFIAIIHDLQSFQEDLIPRNREIALLSQFDAIICHNEKMKKKLEQEGITSSKLIKLELFDYLTNVKPQNKRMLNEGIVIAGNLAPFKASYIYKLAETKLVPLVLYGPNFDCSYTQQIEYQGTLPADQLIGSIKGAFGLVWDGNSLSECNGTFGKYQTINNPHRVSMYLTAQIPILIWNKAALRDFIVSNNLGIGIDSLCQIPDTVANISNKEYQSMVDATKAISSKLRSGFFTSKAINESLKMLK